MRPLLGVAVAMCFVAPAVHANPTGATVVNGNASFATSGSTLTVTNTPGTIINWQQFSIQANEVTRFLQQSATSAVLNRVIGGDPSAILGTLASNGRVYLINGSGITIGAGARIDVAGFAASTLNMSDADFISGRRMFQGTGGEGALTNAGRVSTPEGGFVYLVAPKVENQAEAVITSPKGEVLIAAGRTVELVNAREPDVRVEFTAGGEAVNAGEIVASSGSVGIYGTLVRNAGRVSASRAEAGPGGTIVFRASEDALLESGARVEATGDTGGTVRVLGQRVGVLDGASIDASGDAGGGTVLVGGDLKGGNPDVPNAWRTYFGEGAEIRADGGKVVVWSDDVTRAYGTILAPGGFVEVSGANLLDFAATVVAATILLDPRDITIQNTGGGANGELGGSDLSVLFADGGTGDFAINDETLEALTGNIVLQAARDITINNNLSGGLTLTNAGQGITLQAGRDITVGSAITTNGGAIHLEADSPHASNSGTNDGRHGADGIGQLTFTSNGELHSNGGPITLIGGGAPIVDGGGIVLSENHVIDAGAGGINIALSGNAPLGIGSIGLLTQILGNPMDELHTTGALVIGTATTAGSDGRGTGALTLLADGISNIYPGSAIDLSPQTGSTFTLIAGDGGIVLDQPLTTYQDTIISTTGTLTINDPINTTNNDLQLIAANVVTGSNGSINTGAGVCSGAGCPVSSIFWDGGAGTLNWFDAANWSTDALPTLADLVTIASGADAIVVGAAGAQAKSIISNRAFEISGAGTLNVAEPSQFSDLLTLAGGSLLGTGSVSVTGPGGGFVWSAGTMAAGGNFQLVSGRSGTLNGSLTLNRLFENEGLLTLSNATLSGTGTIASSGTVTAAAGTTNTVSTLFQNISGTIAGALQVNGALAMGNFPVNEGAIVVGAAGSFTTGTLANQGSIGGTGDFTVTTDFDASTGSIGTTLSDLSLARTGAFSVGALTAVDSITLRAGGTVTLNGDVAVTGGSGDSVVIAGTSFDNSGGHAIDPGAGRFLVWSGNPAADDRGGLTYSFKQYNASYGATPVLGAGNGFLYSVAPVVTAGLTGTTTKVYDGGNAAALVPANYTVSGAIDGDTVSLNNPAVGLYADKNVGTGKTVSVSGLAIASATNGAATVYGYQLASSSAGAAIGEITPAMLAGSITAADRIYDATADATITGRALSGVIGGDDVSYVGGTATFGDKNVGPGKMVTASGLALSGTDAANYTVNTSASTTASITPASLTGSITAADKVYDATTGATITGRFISGVLGSDSVSYTGGTATFGDKNVGAGKTVTGTGLALSGTDAGNYTVNSSATTIASIAPAALTLLAAADTKIYDGTTASSVIPGVSGLLAGDSISGLAQAFDSPEVGARTLLVQGGYALNDGNGGANYAVSLLSAPGTIEAVPIPPSVLTPPPPPPLPEANLTTPPLGTQLFDLNSGQNVSLGENGLPDPGIYLSEDTAAVLVVGQSQVGSQLNVASTLLFPVVTYDSGLYVNSETGTIYAVDEGTVLDPGVYYNKDTQTVLVVSSNDDGNVEVKSADIKEAVETVASGGGSKRVATVSCR